MEAVASIPPGAIMAKVPQAKNIYKPTILERVLDDAVALIYPTRGIERKMARRKYKAYKFNYEGARPGIYRSQAQLIGNASPETPTINYDRIRLIWEIRDLEQNMPFVPKMLGTFEDYVLGDFRLKSKATSEADRAAIDGYWQMWSNFCDPTGREVFQGQSRLALRNTIRDGNTLGVVKLEEFPALGEGWEYYQINLIEADRIGYPYEASFGNGYLNGVIYDPATGFVQGYRVYQRDPISNAYTNPVDIPSDISLYLQMTKRSDGLREPTEFAACVPIMRDIQENDENERLTQKYMAAQGGVVTRLTGDQSTDTDIYPDYFEQQVAPQGEGQLLQAAKPTSITYLAPGEKFEAFDTGSRVSPYVAMTEKGYRDCCMNMGVPYGFVYQPTTNGTASRLESAQARRTFMRWQRMMRDKWILPIWNRVMIHGVESGQLQLSDQGEKEIGLVKIIWPAHPSVDVGRESSANVSEFNANLKSGESITEERGDDYDEFMGQKKYEQRKERASIGLIESVINNLGPKGADGLFTLYGQVSSGQIPPENARLMLVTLFGLDEDEALAAIPEGFKINPPAAPVAKGGNVPQIAPTPLKKPTSP